MKADKTTSRTYRHLLVRKEYPAEGGYRMEPQPLPNWIYFTITDDVEEDCKYLTVFSRIHMNKQVRVGPVYSRDYSNTAIIKELSGKI